MIEEAVPVIRLRKRVPGPVRQLSVHKNNSDAAVAGVGVAPHVPIATRIIQRLAGLLKPGVLV